MRILCAIIVCLVCVWAADTPPITDETLRRAAIQALFPGLEITADASSYSISGLPQSQVEKCASENMQTEKFESERQLSLRLYRWPGRSEQGMVAVLQYNYPRASPAGSCWSIGRVVHLVPAGGEWRVHDQFLLEAQHHTSIPSIRMLDLTGDGVAELVVESDSGGVGTTDTLLHVFDLSGGSLRLKLRVPSAMAYEMSDHYTQTLDVERTRQTHGTQFWFTRTTKVEHSKIYVPPRVRTVAYPPGSVIDVHYIGRYQEWLKPPE